MDNRSNAAPVASAAQAMELDLTSFATSGRGRHVTRLPSKKTQSASLQKEDLAVPSATIGTQASRGVFSSLSSRWSRTLLQLASSVVLARILSPADFGLIALITVVTGLATLFQDLGLTTAAVRARTITRQQQTTLFVCNIVLGIGLSACLYGLSPVLANLYRAPELADVGRVIAPVFIIGALTGQARASLQRSLRFGALAIAELTVGIVYFVSAVVLALVGLRYWSLVCATLISSIVWAFFLLTAARFRPSRPAPLAEVSSLLAQGLQISAIQASTYFSRSLDVVVVGRFYGVTTVGLYNRASQVVSLAESQLTAAITSVALPVLSRLQDDHVRLNSFLQRAVGAMGYTLVPLFFTLSLAAEPLISTVYGPQWKSAGSLLAILALAGTVRSLLLLIEQAATAIGVMGRQVSITIVVQVISAATLVFAARFSLVTVAVTYVVCTAVSVIAGSLWIARGTVIDVKRTAQVFVRPFIIWCAAYGCARLANGATSLGWSWAGSSLAIGVQLAIAMAFIAAWPGARRDIRDVLSIAASARGRTPT